MACRLVPIILLILLCSIFVKIKNDRFSQKWKYELLYPTFLGDEHRNFPGKDPPKKLNILWQKYIGGGKTVVGKDTVSWFGTGWTGQPTLVKEFDQMYIIIGGFDYKLKKLDAKTGKVAWTYNFDDVVKGSASLIHCKEDLIERVIILQGSRMGFKKLMESKIVPSFRAIDLDGNELWRLNIKRTLSYSRDVDASALVLDSLIFIGAENGVLYIIDPDPAKATLQDGLLQPRIIKEIELFNAEDAIKHKGNLVIESSPVLCQDRIYVAAGSGHVYGINLETLTIDWDFYIGSDLDGTITVTPDHCLIVPVEKQYIKNCGGILKLDPGRPPQDAVIWYYPTEDKKFLRWEGGVIGSASIQDSLIAFRAIDGYLYLINHYLIDSHAYTTLNKKRYRMPKLLFKIYLGTSVSTPLIIGDKLITAGYDCRLKILKIERKGEKIALIPTDSFVAQGFFESTPLVWEKKIYIGCRNGYFYCLGENFIVSK